MDNMFSIVKLPAVHTVPKKWIQVWYQLLHSNLTGPKIYTRLVHWLSTVALHKPNTYYVVVAIMSFSGIIVVSYIIIASTVSLIILPS